jgi:hypothetical protein
MNTQLTTQTKVVTQCVNKTIADDFVRRYQSSTKNALENILCMGEAVNEIYQKVKSKELDNSDLEYFCQSVHLDPKGSTFRKYKAIGQNASRFRQHLEKLPSTFSVLYEMATLDADDFERYISKTTLSKSITLEQFKKIINQTTKLKKAHLYVQPAIKTPRLSVAKALHKINRIEIVVIRDLHESEFNTVIDTLIDFRNKGWINFADPEITQFGNDRDCDDVTNEKGDIDDDEKYFTALAELDARELRV